MIKKIGIIEHYPIITRGLFSIIQEFMIDWEITMASSIDDFPNVENNSDPDLIIYGVEGCMNLIAIQNIISIQRRFAGSRIILIDRQQNGEMLRLYFRNGVFGYLTSSSSPEEIKECILKVLAGFKYIPMDLVQFLLNHEGRVNKPSKKALTIREREIVTLLLMGKGTTLIAHELGLKPSTVSTMKKNVFTKMNVSGILQLRSAMKNDRVAL
jgi:DNA-binding NarL/FixJ family response regulator